MSVTGFGGLGICENPLPFVSQCRIMHGTIGPFDCAVFAEFTLVMGTWWTGILALVRARLMARLVVGTVRGRRVSCIFGIIMWHESNATINPYCYKDHWYNPFLWRVSIVVALEIFFEIFEGVCVEIIFAMVHIVLDVFLGE